MYVIYYTVFPGGWTNLRKILFHVIKTTSKSFNFRDIIAYSITTYTGNPKKMLHILEILF
jgi:hypothetical protein